MTYTITGRVCARPCEGLEVPIDNATVRFYRGEAEQTEERARLAERPLDEEGQFEEVQIPEEPENEDEGPIIVDILVENPCVDGEDDAEPVQATIATIEPSETEGDLEYNWCLTDDQYCRILKEHNCWMVCGQITDCETGDRLSGLDVEVFDADIIQHEALGSDRTDANGWYIIYYNRPDFEKTPARFAPIELIGGPDLFFTVRQGANTLLDESPSDGRQGGRENADHCTHIDLCVDFPDDFPPGILPAAWTSVGRYSIPDSNSLNEFDRDGYTANKKFAFFGTLHLEGSIPVGNVPISGARNNPVRYRFRVEDSPRLKNGTQGNAGQFNQIVGAGNTLFSGVHVGTLVYQTRTASDTIEVRVEPGDLKSGGWVRIDDAITTTFNQTNRPAPLSDYKWTPTGKLAGLNTDPLTTEPNVPDSAADAGDSVPSSDRIADEQIAIQFEAEEQTASGWQPVLGNGRTLNRIVVNNNPEFRKLEVAQLEGNQCQPTTTENVDIEYTLYHPHLRGAELEMRRADQNNWTTLNDSSTELSFFKNTTTASKYDHNNNDKFPIAGNVTKECTYLVRLRSRRRLTTGRSVDHWSEDIQAFSARKP